MSSIPATTSTVGTWGSFAAALPGKAVAGVSFLAAKVMQLGSSILTFLGSVLGQGYNLAAAGAGKVYSFVLSGVNVAVANPKVSFAFAAVCILSVLGTMAYNRSGSTETNGGNSPKQVKPTTLPTNPITEKKLDVEDPNT